jgi:stalled ribosome rescue protein Dom34
MTFHAAVWLDHQEAKIFHVTAEGFDETHVKAPHHHIQHPRKTEGRGGSEDREAKAYYESIAKNVSDAQEILVAGPGTAKLELIKHVHKHEAGLEKKIIGVETVDHPTDGQFVAYVRKYFLAKDALLGTTPQ